VYACQRLVLGHHWPVASHQLAVLGRVWLLADRLVDSLASIHSQLAVIAARLPSAATAQLLSPQQLQHMAETCAGSNNIGEFTSCYFSGGSDVSCVLTDFFEISHKAVLRVHEILVRIRIRILFF
jgi:hypothetical protein